MKVILSIKPEFAYKIFDGSKKYEFRKSLFKRNDIRKVVVYASSPVQQVIGEFDIASILHEETEQLWQKTQHQSGITKAFYDQYFANKETAFAIEVGNVILYKEPKTLKDLDIQFAPQSYVYLSHHQ
jgi:predicted transcriptional regulator